MPVLPDYPYVRYSGARIVENTIFSVLYHIGPRAESAVYPTKTLLFVTTHLGNFFESEVLNGLIDGLVRKTKGKGSYHIRVFSCENMLEMGFEELFKYFGYVQHARVAHRYDAIITASSITTSMVDAACRMVKIDLPHFFTNIFDVGVIERSVRGDDGIVLANGVKRNVVNIDSFTKLLSYMMFTMKQKKILLPNDVSGEFFHFKTGEAVRRAIVKVLADQSFDVIEENFSNASGMSKLLTRYGKEFGLLYLPPECDMLNACIPDLVDVCRENYLLLAGSTRTSLDLGADIGVGGTGHLYGAKLAQMVARYLYEHEEVGAMRTVVINDSTQCAVNADRLSEKGFSLDRKELANAGVCLYQKLHEKIMLEEAAAAAEYDEDCPEDSLGIIGKEFS